MMVTASAPRSIPLTPTTPHHHLQQQLQQPQNTPVDAIGANTLMYLASSAQLIAPPTSPSASLSSLDSLQQQQQQQQPQHSNLIQPLPLPAAVVTKAPP